MKAEYITNWKELQSYIPLLLEKEIAHNIIIGAIVSNQDHPEKEPHLAVVFSREDEPVMLLLQNIDAQALLAVFTNLTDLELQECANLLAKEKTDLPGIMGELPYTEWLSMQYAQLVHKNRVVSISQRIYQLKQVVPPQSTPGKLRLGQAEEKELFIKWGLQFAQDANVSLTEEESEERVSRFLSERRLYVWEDHGEPVSMAAASRPSKTNINISFVYTPANQRKKGYASACVAEVSARLLEEGYQTLSLYTDLSNPTSNHIYQEIGFEHLLDSKLFHFT
ncbi:GNAT family N-acetyltransferase [Alkalicoccobacillus murimartini]|uniref:GNAT family acetyltransferase n=1 Tax=Alkalicoccobacillus murimartini TaxID=171685 RepID=A0ABT9YKW4_9BACI|nr:GNAT family N-acetyltransferase [Alkalicoccobacillus murimartini]MDQ0208493.1 putative GNAT family acetyltransferase [Alkalicoccobacillus murimartini]